MPEAVIVSFYSFHGTDFERCRVSTELRLARQFSSMSASHSILSFDNMKSVSKVNRFRCSINNFSDSTKICKGFAQSANLNVATTKSVNNSLWTVGSIFLLWKFFPDELRCNRVERNYTSMHSWKKFNRSIRIFFQNKKKFFCSTEWACLARWDANWNKKLFSLLKM